jgi:hypothetical protein
MQHRYQGGPRHLGWPFLSQGPLGFEGPPMWVGGHHAAMGLEYRGGKSQLIN